MATWAEMPLNGGTVITRAAHTLGEGEFQRASNVRYNRGDVFQLHRDFGHALYADTLRASDTEAIPVNLTDVKYMGIEGSGDYLIAARVSELNPELIYAPAESEGEVEWRILRLGEANAVGPVSGNLGLVHLGGQFLLGWGYGPGALVTDPTVVGAHRIGMRLPQEAFRELEDEGHEVEWFPSESGFETRRWTYRSDRSMMFMNEVPGITVSSEADPTVSGSPREDMAERSIAAFFYFFTEYDEENDVESRPYGIHVFVLQQNDAGATIDPNGAFDIPKQATVVSSDTEFPLFDFSGYTPKNTRTTHVRLYRQYIESYGPELPSARLWFDEVPGEHANIISDNAKFDLIVGAYTSTREYIGNNFPLGGMVAQIDLSDSANLSHTDSGLDLKDGIGRSWDYYLNDWIQTPPGSWDLGVYYQGAVLLNSLDNPSVLQYSLPGLPEYFPSVNVLPVVTAGEDEILGLARVGDYAMVLTRDNVHRVNFLPGPDDPPQEPLELVSTVGSVSRRGYTVVTLPQGIALVWLSDSQLNLTTGSGSINVCEDFSVAAAELDTNRLSEAILFNNFRAARLELWAYKVGGEQVVYHFYYTREHLKGTGFKMLGPHSRLTVEDGASPDVLGAVAGNSQERNTSTWLFTSEAVYATNVDTKDDDIKIVFPRMLGHRDPTTRISVQRQGLYHTAIQQREEGEPVEGRFYMRYSTKSRNRAPVEGKRIPWTSITEEEWDSNHVRGVSGNWVEPEMILEGPEDISFGPFMLELEVASDGS